MRLEKSSNREAFEIDELLNYSKMEDSPYQIDAGFQKTSTLCEFTSSGAIEDHLFSSLPLSDVFTGYGGWSGLVLYWFLTLSHISELLQ